MESLEQVIASFETNPMSSARRMREIFESNPAGFLETAIPRLRNIKDDAGSLYFLTFLVKNGLIIRTLCDPALLSGAEARHAAEQARKVDPMLETNLFREVFGADGSELDDSQTAYGLRVLDIIGSDYANTRTLTLINRLLKHGNAKIRSKATALVGKMNQDYEWLERSLLENDPRVRANAIEALWRPGIPERFRMLLWSATNDPNNRIAGNALLGLYRQGEAASIPLIVAMLSDPRENFRATGAWVAGQTVDERFRKYLVPMVREQNSLVRRNALQAVSKIKKREDLVQLERLELILFAGGPLSECTTSEGTRSAGDYAIPVAVASPEGSLLTTLLPTDFRIYRGSEALEHYAVENYAAPEIVSITFAFPMTDQEGKSLREIWRPIISKCLQQKRRLDYWAFLEYPIGEYKETKKKPEDVVPDQLQFFRLPAEIEQVMKKEIALDKIRELSETVDLLLTPAPFVQNESQPTKDAQHVIITEFAASIFFQRERLEEIKETALKSGITIHLLSCNPESVLFELVRATGGAQIPFDGTETLTTKICLLHDALISRYLARFECHTGEENEISIEVRSNLSSAKGVIPKRLATPAYLSPMPLQ